ncbi:phage late control D family protein [Paenibacillus elgii]
MPAPRGIVEIDGQLLKWTDIVEIRVIGTLYMAADSFEITVRNDHMLSDWFRKNQEVRIFLGYAPEPNWWSVDDLVHVFTGKIDGISPSFRNSMTCKIIGRDYSAPLIDTTFTVAYAARTSSQIAKMLAGKYGLKLNITDTSEIIERDMYQNRKEWEVLQALADLEGFICHVDKDKAFHFGPRQESDEEVEAELYYRSNLKSNCQVDFEDTAIDVYNQITVRHYRKKQVIEGTAKDEALINAIGQVKERVIYSSKAKTNAQAKEMAQKLLPEFSRYVVTGKAMNMAGNPNLFCEKKVAVHGCGRFDGNYYVERFEHTLNSSGFITNLDLTNLRPENAQQYRQDLYTKEGAIMGSSRKLGSGTI